MSKQDKKDKSNLLAVALLLLSAFFVLLFLLPEAPKTRKGESGVAQTRQFEDKVNKHLFKTSQEIELSREKMRIETAKIATHGENLRPAMKGEDVHRLDFSGDPRAEALLKELGREIPVSGGPTNADEQVQTDLFEAQQAQQYTEAYKKEYARQFIENARRAGYFIKLNEDYKIISVRPLRKPTENFDLFKSQGGGAQ